jgi:hypothetical protein
VSQPQLRIYISITDLLGIPASSFILRFRVCVRVSAVACVLPVLIAHLVIVVKKDALVFLVDIVPLMLVSCPSGSVAGAINAMNVMAVVSMRVTVCVSIVWPRFHVDTAGQFWVARDR